MLQWLRKIQKGAGYDFSDATQLHSAAASEKGKPAAHMSRLAPVSKFSGEKSTQIHRVPRLPVPCLPADCKDGMDNAPKSCLTSALRLHPWLLRPHPWLGVPGRLESLKQAS